ncbi:hypothetical protein CBR_g36965 [Chara braunii]|uniref:Protein phosphatase 1 regulatory subunit 7 n=1 Tax=Chara braunii TaxID=69332 RepID=A0A388JZJ5_CHABU|nr:hypothetical protein CBR_g36965 [Chara braunii]|eukprot:GBG63197.1 hypothetical protein CBR_g36965 [Chara braunii]
MSGASEGNDEMAEESGNRDGKVVGLDGDKEEAEGEEMKTEGGEDEDGLLDLTGNQLVSLVRIPLSPTLTELDLTRNRLSSIEPVLGELPNLQKLSLRQNLLTDASDLAKYPGLYGLRELVLHDNQLKHIPPLDKFEKLELLDVSFNQLKTLAGIEKVSPALKELYAAKNKIQAIEGLSQLSNLLTLELGSNHLRVMENMEGLTSLQNLWLGKNKIREVNLCGLKGLLRISMMSNRLTRMTGFEGCEVLQELYLSHNGISRMEHLCNLRSLQILDLANNRLSEIEDVESLTKLEDFWFNDNQLPSLDGIGDKLKGARLTLTTIYLERNPVASDPDYIGKLRREFPNIQQIDSKIVR